MSAKRNLKTKTAKSYTQISARIEKYDFYLDAGINSSAVSGIRRELDPNEEVYRFMTAIYLSGVCIGSGELAEQPIEITIYGGKDKEN